MDFDTAYKIASYWAQRTIASEPWEDQRYLDNARWYALGIMDTLDPYPTLRARIIRDSIAYQMGVADAED